MKASHVRWLFIALLASLFILSFLFLEGTTKTYGISADWANGHYRYAAGTDPWALGLAMVVIVLYCLLMRALPIELGEPLPGLFRRYIAFWLDFIFAMVAIGPILGILPMIVEWNRTRAFQWTVERDSPASGDGLLVTLSIFVAFGALFVYYTWPLFRRRPSPGTCIFNYQVVEEDGVQLTFRRAALRTFLGLVAMASFPLALFISRDRKNGQFWLDKVFSTRALLSRQSWPFWRVAEPLNFRVPQPFDSRRVRVLTLRLNSFSSFNFEPPSSNHHFSLAFQAKP